MDEGEWFLYTGSGGRDLSGNKRVNKIQSFDQTFDKMNKALLISCEKGLPVRVVRSHKVPPCPPMWHNCSLHPSRMNWYTAPQRETLQVSLTSLGQCFPLACM